MSNDLTRRAALTTCAGAIAMAGAGVQLWPQREASGSMLSETLHMVDGGFNAREEALADAVVKSKESLKLAADLVAQWRSGLRKTIARAGGGVAIVRWDKAMIFMGLAREEGFKAHQTDIGGGVFRIDLSV